MKKLFLLSILLIQISIALSQKAVASQEDIKQFFKTKTCVVLDDNIFNQYNNSIKQGVQKAWYLTDYEFITMNEFKQRMHNPNYSFLIRTKVYFEDKPSAPAYTFLSLVLGKKDASFDELPDICSFPLSYYGVEFDQYIYKMPTLLLFMQRHVEITRDHPELNEKNILNYYQKNMKKVGSKTIYFTKEDLAPDVNTIQKIKKYYHGKVVITTPENIEKIVLNKDKNAIILHIVKPDKNKKKDRCYKMLVGTENGQLYYFNWHKISNKKPAAFLKSDFKKLSNENRK